MEINKSNRIGYIDIAKALLIILVVIGHSTPLQPIVNFIYLFHMPLFIFLSGYFYKDEYSCNIFAFVKKKIISIYIPFIKYELILLLLHNLFLNLNIYSTEYTSYYTKSNYIRNVISILTFRQTEQMAFPFWFLTSIFTIHILFCIISYLSTFGKRFSEYFRAILILLCFIFGNITVAYGIKFDWSLNTSIIALIFYYIGYLYRKYEQKIKMNIKYIVIPLTVMIISSRWRVDISTNIYVNPIFFIVNSLSGIYISIYISKKLEKYNFSVLNYIGNRTIIIMAFQFLGFYIGRCITAEYGLDTTKVYWIIISTCGLIIPLLIDYVLNLLTINSSTLSRRSTKNINLLQ